MIRLALAVAALLVAAPAVAADNFVLACAFGSQVMVFSVEEPALSAFGYPRPTVRLAGSQPGQTRPVLVLDYDAATIRLAVSRTDAPITSTREEHLRVEIDRVSGRAQIREVQAFVEGAPGRPGFQFTLDPFSGTCTRGSRL